MKKFVERITFTYLAAWSLRSLRRRWWAVGWCDEMDCEFSDVGVAENGGESC